MKAHPCHACGAAGCSRCTTGYTRFNPRKRRHLPLHESELTAPMRNLRELRRRK